MADQHLLNAIDRGFPPSGGLLSRGRVRTKAIASSASTRTEIMIAVLNNYVLANDFVFTPDTDQALTGIATLYFNVLNTPERASLYESHVQKKGQDGAIATLTLPQSGTWTAGDQWRADMVRGLQIDLIPGDVLMMSYVQGPTGQALPAGLLSFSLRDLSQLYIDDPSSEQGSYNGMPGRFAGMPGRFAGMPGKLSGMPG